MAGLETVASENLAHPIKQRLRAGDVALGMPVRLGRSGDVARIAKSTGHDFLDRKSVV